MSDRVNSDEAQHDLNLLAAFAEDRLGANERARVTEHLVACALCRETLAALAHATPDALTPGYRSVSSFPSFAFFARPSVWLPMAATLVVATGLTLRLMTSSPVSAPAVHPQATTTMPNERPVKPDERPVVRSAEAPPTSIPTEGLLARRSGERKIGDKTFHLIAGEWVDSSYDRLAGLQVVEVRTSDERADLLRRVPALTPYAGLGNRVTLVLDAVVYRFDVPPQ
jgi:hypothetical protein